MLDGGAVGKSFDFAERIASGAAVFRAAVARRGFRIKNMGANAVAIGGAGLTFANAAVLISRAKRGTKTKRPTRIGPPSVILAWPLRSTFRRLHNLKNTLILKTLVMMSAAFAISGCAPAYAGPTSGIVDKRFVQVGAGSVPRTVTAKLGESISITDKGATVRSADNSAAIQSAMNAGSHVYVPAGVWNVTASVALNSGQYVWGPGVIKRTTPGFIFTASGKSDITVSTNFQGDVNSWALSFKGANKVRVISCRATDIMLVETDSLTSAYATTRADMSRDVIVHGNTGIATLTPNAVSQQFIRLLYTRDFSVTSNMARG